MAGIIAEKEAKGETVPRDAFGHAKLDSVNVGKYYGDKLGALIGAEKVMVQKSGYFARSAAPNSQDLKLIKVRAWVGVGVPQGCLLCASGRRALCSVAERECGGHGGHAGLSERRLVWHCVARIVV